MNCEKCGNLSNLIDSDNLQITVRRWRFCPKCNHKFHTYEIPSKSLKVAIQFVDQTNIG